MDKNQHIALWQAVYNGEEYLLEQQDISTDLKSLDAISKSIPGGAYTTFRTFNQQQTLHLEQHFERLQHSARLANVPATIYSQPLRAAIRRTLEKFPPVEARVRLTLDLEQQQGTVYISLETLSIPSPLQYQQGVCTVSGRFSRHNPQAKLTNFIHTAAQARGQVGGQAYEVLMVNEEGRILEGLTSNFFALIDGKLCTPIEGVLPGLTRAVVLEEARKMGLPVCEQGILLADVPAVQEAFITSVSRAVLPVVQIDEMVVGSGKPGAVTQALLSRYQARITAELENI